MHNKTFKWKDNQETMAMAMVLSIKSIGSFKKVPTWKAFIELLKDAKRHHTWKRSIWRSIIFFELSNVKLKIRGFRFLSESLF